MAAPTPYLLFPGTAREALSYYQQLFGGELEMHTFEEFGRTDGAPEAIAHGVLEGPVSLYGADAGRGETPLSSSGLMFSLLGRHARSVLQGWFAALAEDGAVLDPLVERPWGASDGQVVDRFGLRWLIGFEGEETP